MDIISKKPMEHVTIPKHQNELLNDVTEINERNFWTKEEIKRFLEITKNEVFFVTMFFSTY
jgi:mRNA-degrading endonuclease HigB of HigAB toxin-antitoxin module